MHQPLGEPNRDQLCKHEDTFHVSEPEQEEALTSQWWAGPVLVAINLIPWAGAASASGPGLEIAVPDEQAFAIVERRCITYHAEHPSNPAFPQAPSGVMLDRPDRLRALAARVRVRAVDTKTMPLGNLTGTTDAERDTLGAWLARQQK